MKFQYYVWDKLKCVNFLSLHNSSCIHISEGNFVVLNSNTSIPLKRLKYVIQTMYIHAFINCPLPVYLHASNTYYEKRPPFTIYSFVGTIGHVAHGKSTVVKAISGVQVCSICSFITVYTSMLIFVRLSDSRTN